MALVAATRKGVELVSGTVTTALAGIEARTLAPGPSARLFAGTQGQGVFRSDDGGAGWRPAGLDGLIVKALVVRGDTVWAATKPPRLFRSSDAGMTWEELRAFGRMRRRWWFQPAERPFTSYVSTLAVAPDDPGVVVAGIEAFKLLRSEDAGASWERVGRGIPFDAHQLCFDRDGRLLLAAGGGVAASSDRGATWSKLMAGLDRRYCSCIAADFAEPGSAFLAAAHVRSAHTRNSRACIFRLSGERWVKLTPELEHLPHGLATTASEPTRVYAGLRDGTILHSADSGGSWEVLPVRLDGIRSLLVA